MDDPCLDMDMLADVMNSESGVELPQGVQVSPAARDFLRCCLQVGQQASQPWVEPLLKAVTAFWESGECTSPVHGSQLKKPTSQLLNTIHIH